MRTAASLLRAIIRALRQGRHIEECAGKNIFLSFGGTSNAETQLFSIQRDTGGGGAAARSARGEVRGERQPGRLKNN